MAQYMVAPEGVQLKEGIIYNVDLDTVLTGEKEVYIKLARNTFGHIIRNIFLHNEEIYQEEYDDNKLYTFKDIIDSLDKWTKRKNTEEEIEEFKRDLDTVFVDQLGKLKIAYDDGIIPSGLYSTLRNTINAFSRAADTFCYERQTIIEAEANASESIDDMEDRLLTYIDNLFLYDTVVKEE